MASEFTLHKHGPVILIAGTHTWTSIPESERFQDKILDIAKKHGISRVDTARLCPPTSSLALTIQTNIFDCQGMGDSELTLGKKNVASQFTITTKAPTMAGNGAGSRENVLKAAKESLEVLKLQKVRKVRPCLVVDAHLFTYID